MAMGKRRRRGRQPSMWVATSDLPRSAGHPFYERLNRVLDEAGFDGFVEAKCAPFYVDGVGRPRLAPGRYFRLLPLGYFEGLDSARTIAWRAANSLSLLAFLDVALQEAPPDRSTPSRTCRRIRDSHGGLRTDRDNVIPLEATRCCPARVAERQVAGSAAKPSSALNPRWRAQLMPRRPATRKSTSFAVRLRGM